MCDALEAQMTLGEKVQPIRKLVIELLYVISDIRYLEQLVRNVVVAVD